MELPADAEVLDTTCQELPGGQWFAAIRFKVPGQGGYDRPPHDDMFRIFKSGNNKQRASQWLKDKLAKIEDPDASS